MAAELLQLLAKIETTAESVSFEGAPLKLISLRAAPLNSKALEAGKVNATPVWGAGGNLKELSKVDSPREAYQYSEAMTRVCNYFAHLPLFTFCLVDGRVLGGHVELALSCDQLLMTDHSTLEFRQLKMGLILGYGVSQRLVGRLGYQRVTRALLGSEIWSASQCMEYNAASVVSGDWESLLKNFNLLKENLENLESSVVAALKRQLTGLSGLGNPSDISVEQCRSVESMSRIWKNPSHKRALDSFNRP
jgi:enoyl-CoA hydratase/carnithine racemase